ncbi:hypothetical protein GCM10010309_65810 [Streptomyces violaceochromogenes]|nr:hypothetical protein GCM10010309_65810 [Streptomyces violaceochromogenes]
MIESAVWARGAVVWEPSAPSPDQNGREVECRPDQHMDLSRQETELLAAEIADDTAPFPIRQRLQQRQTTLLAIISQHEANRVHPTSTP